MTTLLSVLQVHGNNHCIVIVIISIIIVTLFGS